MAEHSVNLVYFSILLLIHSSNGGIPGLGDLDDGSPSHETDNHVKDDPISINKIMVQQPRYQCHQCDPPDCDELQTSQICLDAIYCYKSSVRGSDGSIQHARGCSAHHDHYQFTCRSNQNSPRKRHAGQLNVTCCRGDLCNEGDFPELPFSDISMEAVSSGWWKLWVGVGFLLGGMLLVGAILVFVMRRIHRLGMPRNALQKLRAHKHDASYYSSNAYPSAPYYEGEGSVGVVAVAAGDSTLREYLEASNTSGSGSGLPLMVQRTLAKQVVLVDAVGKGRFGSVWRGVWCADSVAVKIFFSRDEESWRRETNIYSTVLLRHDNIVAYIGSDMASRNSCTQLWLITHYHPLGSLYDYLNRTSLTKQQMMNFALSIVKGLLHLHTEIHGTQGKPGIAHRDIKSKNILVKLDGECCIADLGLALTATDVGQGALTTRQGTRRYMSPEMLDHTMNPACFESYRKCDIYALSLVIWELVWCTELGGGGGGGGTPRYRPPYWEWAGTDPAEDDMRKIVCLDGARPTEPDFVNNNPTLLGMCTLIRECWHGQPAVRLPALRIKKTLLKLAAHDPDVTLQGGDDYITDTKQGNEPTVCGNGFPSDPRIHTQYELWF